MTNTRPDNLPFEDAFQTLMDNIIFKKLFYALVEREQGYLTKEISPEIIHMRLYNLFASAFEEVENLPYNEERQNALKKFMEYKLQALSEVVTDKTKRKERK